MKVQPGDRVRSADYGDGLVAIANSLILGVTWDEPPAKDGRRYLDHSPSFAERLEILPPRALWRPLPAG